MGKELARGVSATGRSKSYHRRGIWAIKKKHGGKFPQHEKQAKPTAKAPRAPRFYPADDTKQPRKRRSTVQPAKLRSAIKPGSVLILLAGRFKGKRVVFLKQLESGLLLVTGPFKVNSVPLRRVNQAYVIATSTSVDVSKVDTSPFADAYFKRQDKEAKAKKGEDAFFEEKADKPKLSSEHVENQKKVDAALMGALSEECKGYLASRFSLSRNDRPHLMKF